MLVGAGFDVTLSLKPVVLLNAVPMLWLFTRPKADASCLQHVAVYACVACMQFILPIPDSRRAVARHAEGPRHVFRT